ncbi:ABC transporter related [Acidimicrobium ferrooxidans DSM 10331]|uniref:ABC transporter related n=1 Tax=Acidimicrobium ferrooxidans (strain DSM 10331 / JCM 15462 / NBRC 103882 / ICP) TaxID=525909 RepID=C7LZ24_ACIFD|nr:ABC transporter ATP-binding protein [Acidimicrobium ferrooxidans]ACU53982.1 ABC transporter related [Acidimicrobium ferrooxidans DSM 10331]
MPDHALSATSADWSAGDSHAHPALELDGLTKRFGDRVAFESVTLRVDRGEVFGLLGPNGAGKTTLVRTCATLVRPSEGRARVLGIDLEASNGPEIRRRIAVMPEAPGLYGNLSVVENLRLFARLYGVHDVDRAIREALDAVDLSSRRDDACRALSKGLRQRVAIARTLLGQPELIFLDEPTSGLDPVAARDVLELIASLRAQGRTVLITTHRLDEAERVCDRVAILRQRLLAVGKPGELGLGSQRSLVVRVGGAAEDAKAHLAPVVEAAHVVVTDEHTLRIDGAEPDELAPVVAEALVHAGDRLLELASPRERLEEVYLELVGGETKESDR